MDLFHRRQSGVKLLLTINNIVQKWRNADIFYLNSFDIYIPEMSNTNWSNFDIFGNSPYNIASTNTKLIRTPNPEKYFHLDDSKPFNLRSPLKAGKDIYISPLNLKFIQSPLNQRRSPSLFDEIGHPVILQEQSHVQRKQAVFGKRLFDSDQQQADSEFQEDFNKEIDEGVSIGQNYQQKRKSTKDRIYQELNTTAKKKEPIYKQQRIQQRKARPRDKGLRKLSSRAYEIVQQMKTVTYKDVASKLVDELYQQTSLDGQGRDEQNIKRRVYDALNVLIALGILRKDGRKITAQIKGKKKWNQLSTSEEYSLLSQTFTQKRQNVTFLKQKVADLKNKYAVIKKLIEKNKGLNCNEKDIIRFPFIGVSVRNFLTENISLDQNSFYINSEHRLRPFGDVDALSLLEKNQTIKDKRTN